MTIYSPSDMIPLALNLFGNLLRFLFVVFVLGWTFFGLVSRVKPQSPEEDPVTRKIALRPRRLRKPLHLELIEHAVGFSIVWCLIVGAKLAPLLSGDSGSSRSLTVPDIALTLSLVALWVSSVASWWSLNRRVRTWLATLPSQEALRSLSSDEFVAFVAHLFRRRGFKANVVGHRADPGVDIVVKNPHGGREVVQCQRWTPRWIAESAVQEFYKAVEGDGKFRRGYIITTSGFSSAAAAWARDRPLELVDGQRLWEAVEAVRDQESIADPEMAVAPQE